MTLELRPVRNIGGEVTLPGDKSIGHRAALFSLVAKQPLLLKNFPTGEDCQRSLEAVQALGTTIDRRMGEITLTPPERLVAQEDMVIDCGNSGTTARLLSGVIAGSDIEVTLSGDESLSRRPMRRIMDPLTTMGAKLFAEDGHLPMRIQGGKLMPLEYRLPVASAQVKSSLLLAGLASHCSAIVREDVLTRDHTERMIAALGSGITVRDVKPVVVQDPVDPRKRKLERQESFKREITLSAQAEVVGGTIDIPGDISTAAFFFAVAAISGKELAVLNVGLNPTRSAILEYLKSIGCKVEITDRCELSGEPRGTVIVTGGDLRPKKITGPKTAGLIDEIPIVAVMAAFASGTTVIRDAAELRVKESDRLAAVAHNLSLMGVKCGVMKDGLVIEGGHELQGTDFTSFGDHRIAMAFSVASLFLVGPSTIDDERCAAVSCPEFYDLLERIKQ